MRTTSKRWMRKRALCILLVCAMLFSGMEFTAFAVEPGADEMTVSGAGMETVSGDDTAAPPDEMQTEAENKADSIVGIEQEALSFEAKNDIGSLFVDEIQEVVRNEQAAMIEEYAISDIQVSGTTAIVTFHAVADCTVVVSVYEEGSLRPYAFGNAPAAASGGKVEVAIETGQMPEYFELKAYLVEPDSLRPLSKEFYSRLYTQEIQFMENLTVNDFDPEIVVNLDEDETTNFIAFTDDTVLIRETAGTNKLIAYEEASNTYSFENVDEKITGLKQGDTFVYCGADNQIEIIQVQALNLIPDTPADTAIETEESDTENPEEEESDVQNPDEEEPDTENPDGEEPDTENPDGEEPDTENPDEEEPDTENPDEEETDIREPDTGNIEITDYLDEESAEVQNPETEEQSSGNVRKQQIRFQSMVREEDQQPDTDEEITDGEPGIADKTEGEENPKVENPEEENPTIEDNLNKTDTEDQEPEDSECDGQEDERENDSENVPGEYDDIQATEVKGNKRGEAFERSGYHSGGIAQIVAADLETSADLDGKISAIKIEESLSNTSIKKESLDKLPSVAYGGVKAKYQGRESFGENYEFDTFYLSVSKESGGSTEDESGGEDSGGTNESGGEDSGGTNEGGGNDDSGVSANIKFDLTVSFAFQADFKYYRYHQLRGKHIDYASCGFMMDTRLSGSLSVQKEFSIKLLSTVPEIKSKFFKLEYVPKFLVGGKMTLNVNGTQIKDTYRLVIGPNAPVEAGLYCDEPIRDPGKFDVAAETYIGVVWAPEVKAKIAKYEILDVGAKIGIELVLEAAGDLYGQAHPCKSMCTSYQVLFRVPFSITIHLAGTDVLDTWFPNAPLPEDGNLIKRPLFSAYKCDYHKDYGAGLGEDGKCPYIGSVENEVEQVCLGAFDRSAAVMGDGSLYTWGSNVSGSLGTGGTDDKSIPTKNNELRSVKTMIYSNASNTRVSAAITKAGGLYMWGQNSHGALGNGSTNNMYVPTKILENVKSVSLGYYSGAAVTQDGQLYTWGKNSEGQLGNNTNGNQLEPVKILAEENMKDVCLGTDSAYGYSAAVTKDGKLYMWGYNGNGELGNGEQGTTGAYNQKEPIRVLENEKIKEIRLSKGRGYSAAISEDGQLYMWGYNFYGQLGNGTTASQTEPVKILEGTKIKEVVVGSTSSCYHTAAITEDGQLYLWGRNVHGQLGKGDTDNSTVPVKVEGLGKVRTVCLSDEHTAAITESGELYTWGYNNRGQLGDGSTKDRYTPVKILESVVSVDVQNTYMAAVTTDGGLWTWGYNNAGQLGNGEKSYQPVTTPTRVTFPADTAKTVQGLSEGYDVESGEILAIGDAYVFDEEALAAKDAAYVYETFQKADDPENAPEIVPDTGNPLKQTANFAGLKSQEIYNIYVMKDRDAAQRLSQDNLLYIMQAVSGADGNLSVTYEMREACGQPDVFCVGMTRTDLSSADIRVPDVIYDGEEHVVEVIVTVNGRTLVAGADYEIYGDCVVSAIGEYKVVIKGIGTYCGEKEVTFKVKEKGDDPNNPDNPDNPDTPAYGDVLPEDVPADGKIPEGLWIAGVMETGYDYTGTALKPEVRVYDHKTLLKEKSDYTIAYKNNTKAYVYAASDVNFAANKAPAVTVTGKGNYTGKDTQTFIILPLDISVKADTPDGDGTENGAGIESGTGQADDDIFAADDMTIAGNGKNQKPVPALMWNDKKLKNNTDYTVTYYDSTGVGRLDYVKEAGSYYIELTGKGNFTGTRRIRLAVTAQSGATKLMSKMTVLKIPNQPYTGSVIRPTVTVKNGKTTLEEGVHYTVNYSRNTQIGTAYAVITGIEAKGYSGTKRVSFKITGGSVSKAKVTGLADRTFMYSGAAIKPELTVTVRTAGEERTLTEGDDYRITWQKNRDAGTATAVITGIGGYTGTLKKTFKIRAYDVGMNADGRFKAQLLQEFVPYAKGGAKPPITVTFIKGDGSTQELTEGKDYTLAYQNHTAPNDGSRPDKLPTVIIKGKGNFKGTYGTKLNYKITIQDLGAKGIKLTAADRTYQNKKNIYTTKVTITDIDGKTLKAGKDYEKTLTYAYKNETPVKTGTAADSPTVSRNAGEIVDKNDIIPAGTVLAVTADGKGNYTGSSTGEYRITQADISKAVITVKKQTYTGSPILLNQDKNGNGTVDEDERDITVKIKGKDMPPDQYEIVPDSYRNNVKKGTASVTIRGVDNYGGTKNVKFMIKAKGFLWWWR